MWYLNLKMLTLTPVDAYYTEGFHVNFNVNSKKFELIYTNNAGECNIINEFPSKAAVLEELKNIARHINTINYPEEEKVEIEWDWDKYVPYVEPCPNINPYITPYLPSPIYYGPTVTCITADTSDNSLVWYTIKGELNPVNLRRL